MQNILTTFNAEGFTSVVRQDEDGRIFFTADADIDADGANGQSGKRPAYDVFDTGSELLANGGMGIRNGQVIGIHDWFKDIVILNEHGQPKVFDGGLIASQTAYHFKDIPKDNSRAYVDSETVPYIVVPPQILNFPSESVLGCRCRATNNLLGQSCYGIVADIGPRNKIGEISIAMARSIGIPHSPRVGGEDRPVVLYELWPGVHGFIDNKEIALLSKAGIYS